MKKILRFTAYTVGFTVVLLLTWHIISAQPVARKADITSSFSGSFLAVSDADMIATAYANGITNKANGVEDSLAHVVIENGIPKVTSQIHASNSVISWPAVLEWHPTKRIAYVAETRAAIAAQSEKMENVFADFPVGRHISVYDYRNPKNPTLVQKVVVGENLQNVTINSDGNLLAAGTTAKGEEIMIATLKNGLIDQQFYFTVDGINYSDNQDGGIRTIEFHPNENIIAVNLNGKSVAFYAIAKSREELQIKQIGKAVAVEKKLSVGNWHPSGKYFIVANVNWGKGNLGAIFNKKGHLISVGFDRNGNHEIISKAKVGLSPEGFDISPDGEYAIAVNMRRTYGPKVFWFVPGTKYSSLSLVKIDSATGELQVVGNEYRFEGVLPEDAIFDEESNSIAVAVYNEKNQGFPEKGWIEFWEIKNDLLIRTNSKLYVTRGVHNLLLTPKISEDYAANSY
ncbi:MAG: hypothetical protein AAFQ94_28290 [Bacteroidota bacterium]